MVTRIILLPVHEMGLESHNFEAKKNLRVLKFFKDKNFPLFQG